LTGCLYQVIQTTGQQGSNVLKLLPILKSKGNPIPVVPCPLTPSKASTLNVPQPVISSPPLPPVSIISRPSPVSVPLVQKPTVRNYIIATRNNLTNTLHIESPFSFSPETTFLLDNGQLTLPANSVSGNPTFIMMNKKPVSPIKPTPMLPSGHALQIPAHAEVISVPVSSLPFSIQQKILPQAGGTDVSKIPSVIYVSPVNTIKTNNNQSALLQPTPNISSITSGTPQQRPPSSGSEPPKGPMKWVVQENQESAACLVPVKSSNDTASKILKMLSKTKMEDVNLTSSDCSKVVQIKDNALVMCNNKIFLLTKKGTELVDAERKKTGPPPYSSPDKPTVKTEPIKDLSNKVVQVVLSKNKPPPPSTKESVQSNVVSTAKPKRKSTTPRAMRDNPEVIYVPDDDDCGQVSEIPSHVPSSPVNPAKSPAVNAATKGDSVKTNNQLQPKSQGIEIAIGAKASEVTMMDDRSWRLKFGLVKKEKIILKRIPLIQAESPLCTQKDPSSVEKDLMQLKRKSSSVQTVILSKKQKCTEGGNMNPTLVNPAVTPDSPSTSSMPWSYSVPAERSAPETTERSSSTWSPTYYGGETYPPDHVHFQVNQEITEPFSEASLPSQRSRIDSMYPDETTKDEKIQRLKEQLKEREKALEALRRQQT
ncbi:Ligand dependent nuclear receptor interacting factor 1, partial [Pristimantis euphronides]